MAAVDAGAAVARGVVHGVAEGMAKGAQAAGDFFGGIASAMGAPGGAGGAPAPSGTSPVPGAPGPSADPSAAAATADSDPVDDFFGDMFDDGPDAADQSFLGATGGGAMPGEGDPAGAQALPVVADPNGQAMLMTGQGALPVVMSQQGPMAVTPQGGAIPLQMLTGRGAQPQPSVQTQVQALQQRAAQVQALTEMATRRQAAAPPPAPYSGVSAFVPPKKAPMVFTAPAPATKAPAVKVVNPDTAPTTAKADPTLAQGSGIGVRIGTTGTGDGNIR
ncbi:MAG TPA: hypothetical protein VFA20_15760 [Myxococcaceae bacterium]|nr:hypothetical protein [Myxococcaceae bacterium]